MYCTRRMTVAVIHCYDAKLIRNVIKMRETDNMITAVHFMVPLPTHCRDQKIPITVVVSVGSGVDPPKELGKLNVHDSLNPKTWIDFLEMLGSAVSQHL